MLRGPCIVLLLSAAAALTVAQRVAPLSGWRSQRYSGLLEGGSVVCAAIGLTAVAARQLGSAALTAVEAVVFVPGRVPRRAVLVARQDRLRQ